MRLKKNLVYFYENLLMSIYPFNMLHRSGLCMLNFIIDNQWNSMFGSFALIPIRIYDGSHPAKQWSLFNRPTFGRAACPFVISLTGTYICPVGNRSIYSTCRQRQTWHMSYYPSPPPSNPPSNPPSPPHSPTPHPNPDPDPHPAPTPSSPTTPKWTKSSSTTHIIMALT